MNNIFSTQSKLTDLTVENILSTGVSVKMQITDSISENLSNSDLESIQIHYYTKRSVICNYYTHFVFVNCIKSLNIHNTLIKNIIKNVQISNFS